MTIFKVSLTRYEKHFGIHTDSFSFCSILAARETTANLYREVHELKEALTRKKTDELDISTSITIDRQEDAQARIQALQKAISTARGKREMVKGVLRVSLVRMLILKIVLLILILFTGSHTRIRIELVKE